MTSEMPHSSKTAAKLTGAAVALALGLGAVTGAQAASVKSFIQGGANDFSDESREYLIDRGDPDPLLDPGDSLRAFYDINTLNSGSANLGGATPNSELTGVAQFLVTSKTALGGGNYSFTFGPDPAFEANLCGGVSNCASGFTPGAGAMMVMFDGSGATKNFDLSSATDDVPGGPPASTPTVADTGFAGFNSVEESVGTTATDGTHFWTLGFAGLAGEGFNTTTLALLGDDVRNSINFTSGTTGAVINGGLNVLAYGAAGPAPGSILRATTSPFGGLVDVAFSGGVRGIQDLQTPFDVSNNINGSFQAVPEPGALALLGAGLLGFGAASRRRRRAA